MPPGMMLIKAVASSICGSDLYGKCHPSCPSNSWRSVIPYFWSKRGAVGGSGHETIGEVVEVKEPCSWKKGQLVLAMVTTYIQVVDSVRQTFENQTGVSADTLPKQGCFAEYYLAYQEAVVEVPMSVPSPTFDRLWYVAAQPLGTILHAVSKLGSVVGLSAAVVGQGQNGLLMTQMLRRLGCKTVIAVEKIDSRLQAARKAGATMLVRVKGAVAETAEEVRRANGGEPVDISVEMVGHHGEALDLAAAVVKKEGTVLVFGLPPHPDYSTMSIRPYDFSRNVRYTCTHSPSLSMFRLAMDMIREKRFDVSSLFTHRIDFVDFPSAFDMASNYKAGVIKTLVVHPGAEKHSRAVAPSNL
eukprot:Sspe_Gene.58774::Locus_32261_Transcript_1_1_Confidence_1.000_Length_2124::g.58774::m.58774/K00008/SORD, gutB; L-iditol 2-dehydrogenase